MQNRITAVQLDLVEQFPHISFFCTFDALSGIHFFIIESEADYNNEDFAKWSFEASQAYNEKYPNEAIAFVLDSMMIDFDAPHYIHVQNLLQPGSCIKAKSLHIHGLVENETLEIEFQ